ncbi:MAG: S-methyl-5'-thioadenosine phosphorylase [Proteobacteria bacterium]|nr:S-methyl-5'-thioadenosine phosphorylase [Pseudomonadota bacterium]
MSHSSAQSQSKKTVLGVIGGSGVYKMDGVTFVREHNISTPFGEPSDVIFEATIHGRSVFFLPRHGRGHRFTPTEVNYQANIHALKQLGVTHVLAVSAVGIMKESIKPGDMVLPDQLFDRTRGSRKNTFFGEGIVGHVMFADPFCAEMRSIIQKAALKEKATVHDGGTYVCMEGPAFSTRAESHFYRKTIAPAVIGMTAIPEAKLAREAEMCYGMLALATDYDCWHEGEDDVSVVAVMAVVKANAALANNIIKRVAKTMPETSTSPLLRAAEFAIMSDRAKIPQAAKEKASLLWGRYL